MQIKKYPKIGESLYTAELANGLKLKLIPKPGFSTCYAAFATNYGGAHRRFEIDGQTIDTPAGVAHFLEHKMFDLPNGDNALNALAANGADPNAFTSSGITCYYFECTHSFEENLRMLLHFVSTPYFLDETVQKEQGIIAQEIRMGEDSPGSAIYYNLLEMLYEHHPIRDKVAGTVESISHITAKTLYDCHKVFYAPSNMVLCIEGDLDAERILEIVNEELPQERRSVPQADFGEEESLIPAEIIRREQMAVSAPQFLIGAKIKPAPDGQEALRQRLVSQLALRLLVGYSSQFYSKAYADGSLNRDFDYEADFSAGTGTIIIGGESAVPEKVFEDLKAEVRRVKEQGLDSLRFERAKRASLGARLRGFEDFESVCVATIMGEFAGYCSFDALEVLEDISIDECASFICENMADERLAISIIEPKKG